MINYRVDHSKAPVVLISTYVTETVAQRIDACILKGNPGDEGYFRSRSAFLAEAARRLVENVATRCNDDALLSATSPNIGANEGHSDE